jgi:calcineurin-like phosphoesterase family protein
MVYFTADLHFGHANVINHCNRPFATADEMNEALIRNWNRTVHRDDDVYILGDVTMKPADEAHRYISELKGRKYLIRGNHDRFIKNYEPYIEDFVWVKDYEYLHYGDRHFVLFHYPIAEWYGAFRGAIHLYGHVHNSEAGNAMMKSSTVGFAYNVGVDCNNFCPVSVKDILEYAEIWELEYGGSRADRHGRNRAEAEPGLYHYSRQKEVLHEFAAENQARLMRYMESHDISLDDDKNIVVVLHGILFHLVQDVLTARYNTQANIDETSAFLSRVKTLLDEV